MKSYKEAVEEEYEGLKKAFGFNGGWNQIHLHYSPWMFCKENRESLIGEYFVLKDFAKRAKDVGVHYYYGIDEFLREYETAVMSRVNLD